MNLVRGHTLVASAKQSNFWNPLPSFPLSTNIKFWSEQTPLLDILN